MRQEILERRRKKHLLNEQEVSRRWAFEESVSLSRFKHYFVCILLHSIGSFVQWLFSLLEN